MWCTDVCVYVKTERSTCSAVDFKQRVYQMSRDLRDLADGFPEDWSLSSRLVLYLAVFLLCVSD